MFDILQLKSFCAVVETQSFTEAGKKVHRTQSTVSVQIANLEKLYGCTLLERLPDRTVPTEPGRLLYGYAQRIRALAEESLERISALEQILTGDCVIGASTIPASYILPQIIGVFLRKHPEVNIVIRTSNSKTVIDEVLARSIQIGTVGQKVKNAGLEYIKLADDNIVLAVPEGHPWAGKRSIAPAELSREPYIDREEGSGTRAAVEAELKKNDITQLNRVMQVGSSEAVKQSVRSGLGVSFISQWALKDAPLPSVNVKGFTISRTFYIVFLKKSGERRMIKAFTDLLNSR